MTRAHPLTDRTIERPRAVHHRESVMGTVVTIDVYTKDGTIASGVSLGLARARAVLHRADAVFSTWKPHSPMSRLRRGEITCGEAPSEVTEVLERCAVAREVSGGWFDPWAMPGGVDPTGYVKGWAAQCALAELASSEGGGRHGERSRRHRELPERGASRTIPDRHCRPQRAGSSCLRRRALRRHRHIGHLRARRASDRSSHQTTRCTCGVGIGLRARSRSGGRSCDSLDGRPGSTVWHWSKPWKDTSPSSSPSTEAHDGPRAFHSRLMYLDPGRLSFRRSNPVPWRTRPACAQRRPVPSGVSSAAEFDDPESLVRRVARPCLR